MNYPPPKNLKRRANLLYRLRQKGIRCNTRQRTIYLPYNGDLDTACQIGKLRKEYGFIIQFEII